MQTSAINLKTAPPTGNDIAVALAEMLGIDLDNTGVIGFTLRARVGRIPTLTVHHFARVPNERTVHKFTLVPLESVS